MTREGFVSAEVFAPADVPPVETDLLRAARIQIGPATVEIVLVRFLGCLVLGLRVRVHSESETGWLRPQDVKLFDAGGAELTPLRLEELPELLRFGFGPDYFVEPRFAPFDAVLIFPDSARVPFTVALGPEIRVRFDSARLVALPTVPVASA